MQPATLLQEICNGRSFGSGFQQFCERKLLGDTGKKRDPGNLQRVLIDRTSYPTW
jgi:hypothetical protein